MGSFGETYVHKLQAELLIDVQYLQTIQAQNNAALILSQFLL